MSSFNINRGEHVIYAVCLTENGVSVDLTGVSTIRWTMRTTPPAASVVSDTDATLTKTLGSGVIIANALGGVIEVEFFHADTNTLDPATYIWGMEYLPAGDSEPRFIGSGTVTIIPDIVRGL